MIGFDGVVSFGIAIDAEKDADRAFQSVRGALQQANLPVPESPLRPVGQKPQVCVLIIPPDAKKAAIEDLCLRAVESDEAMDCVDAFFSCLNNLDIKLSDNIAKAKAQVFLASRPTAGISIGVAAKKGYWPWNNSAFNSVKRFLQIVAQPQAYPGQAPSV